MKKINSLCCTLLLLLAGAASATAQSKVLTFNANKKFKIVQFTDVHWVPNNPASEEAAERMNEILDAEKPDLVIYTGDLIFAKPASEGLDRALEPAISRNIPFAVTWGNHDDEQDMTRAQLTAYVQKKPGNLTSTVEGIHGITNYMLPIKSSNGKKNAAALYVLDSGNYSPTEQARGYDWIRRSQIEWYCETSKKLTAQNEDKPLPALAFFHIALPEYNEAAQDEGAHLVGTRREKACAPAINTGLFAEMLQAGDVMGVFVGHDHVNDYAVDWREILLCFGRYTGGNTVYNDIPGGNGARIIELTEGERGFKSWIRIKGGKIINDITYPADFARKKGE
ncbi:MAG: metallophosphoesterase family protein [Phocaeicola sp.]